MFSSIKDFLCYKLFNGSVRLHKRTNLSLKLSIKMKTENVKQTGDLKEQNSSVTGLLFFVEIPLQRYV